MNKKDRVIDIHTHIIPGIDDGAKSIEMTLEMVQASIKDGVEDIVATPHYRVGICDVEYSKVKEKVENLNLTLKKMGVAIKIHYGQEVYFNENLLQNLENGLVGTIDGTRYLLLELSTRHLDNQLFNSLYELRLKNIIPIIAHPERYLYIQRNLQLINDLIKEGCLFQLNAGSIIGRYGENSKKAAKRLLKNKIYSFIGSDSHDCNKRRTCIKESLNEICKIDSNFEETTLKNATKIFSNKQILLESKVKRKGIFSFF